MIKQDDFKYFKKIYLDSISIFLQGASVAAFLVFYPNLSVVGFVLFLSFLVAAFLLYFIGNRIKQDKKWMEDEKLVKELRTSYLKKYSELEPIFIKTLIFSLIACPIAALVFYIIKFAVLMDFFLSAAALIIGLTLSQWYRYNQIIGVLNRIIN